MLDSLRSPVGKALNAKGSSVNISILCEEEDFDDLLTYITASDSINKSLLELENINTAYSLWFLGTMYLEGEVVDKNLETAKKHFTKSAQLNDTMAMIELADIYEENDKEKALSWYIKAATLGSKTGMHGAGVIYLVRYYETRKDSDYEKSLTYLRNAKNDPECLSQMAELLRLKKLYAYSFYIYLKSIYFNILRYIND